MSVSPHIHILLGTDEFAIRQQATKFESMFPDPTTAGMNTSRFDAKTANEREINNAIGAMPFLAAQRLVVLENVSKRWTGQDGHKKFVEFLATVPPSTKLVIMDFEEVKERDIPNHWLARWAAKAEGRAAFKPLMLPRQNEMPAWIINETKRQGGQMDRDAANRLAEMTGTETRQAAQEITKLLTYVNFAHPVGLEDVEAVSIVTAGVSVFDLVDALGGRDGRRAQKLLHRLLEDQDAFEIYGMIIRQFRILTITREMMDEGGTLAETTAELGMHPFVVEKAWGQAQKFSQEMLASIYRRLLSMDEASKSGGMPLDAALDMLIVELTR